MRSYLLDLPNELITQIVSQITPIDLLSLAQLNKHYRRILMSQSSQSFWRTVLQDVHDLPECPAALCEPQYISSIWSKTCSSCGTPAWRAVTVELLVRLCSVCIDEQVCELKLDDPLAELVPTAGRIADWKAPNDLFALRRDVESELNKAQDKDIDGEDYCQWRSKRMKTLESRRAHSESLRSYLKDEPRFFHMRLKPEMETRFSLEGWTRNAFHPPPDDTKQWKLLTHQPEELTDRIWAHIYPKIRPLLEKNQIYYENRLREERRKSRIYELEEDMNYRRKNPCPLVRVTMTEFGSYDEQLNALSRREDTPPPPEYPDLAINEPSPSTTELLTWPIIQSIVDMDAPADSVCQDLREALPDFSHAMLNWRSSIEHDLAQLWRDSRSTNSAGLTDSDSSVPPDGTSLTIPELVVSFLKPDGSYTEDISEISSDLQRVLRADSTFKSPFGYTYPDVVPPPVVQIFDGHDELYGDDIYVSAPGERWDASKVAWDAERSEVARKMLQRLGRPDATTAEMRAIFLRSVCTRCSSWTMESWESLVDHFLYQDRQWKLVQDRIKARPGRPLVFNHTHDLGATDPTPFARLLSFDDEEFYRLCESQAELVACLRCEKLGVQTKLHAVVEGGFESPFARHLREVHNIVRGVSGRDYRSCDGSSSEEQY